MKKKILSVVLAGVMVMSMLTACGGSDKAETAAPAAQTTEAKDDSANDSSEVSGDTCSDDTFAILQDNYATVVDCYNAVKGLYESDEVAGDADIEDLMNQAADIINQMGEISQDTITEADAVDLNDTMVSILEGLSGIVDAMDTADGTDAGEGCSDETFSILQDNYATLSEVYSVVYDAYMSDGIEQDDDIEAALTQTADIMDQMGEISQDTITEADAVDLNDSMVSLLDVLQAVVDAM